MLIQFKYTVEAYCWKLWRTWMSYTAC